MMDDKTLAGAHLDGQGKPATCEETERAIGIFRDLLNQQQIITDRLKARLVKAERDRDVLMNLFVIDMYEADPACRCEGKCKHCARTGCEACCEAGSADHGSRTDEETAAYLAEAADVWDWCYFPCEKSFPRTHTKEHVGHNITKGGGKPS